MSLDFSSKVSILAGCNQIVLTPDIIMISPSYSVSHGQGWHQPHAVWQRRFFKSKYFCSSKTGLPTPEMRWSKWVAKAGLLCEVLLALLYNHLYYQIKYKMTAHNKVVTADTVSWPLPIITLDTFASSDSLTRDLLRHVLFCHFSGKSEKLQHMYLANSGAWAARESALKLTIFSFSEICWRSFWPSKISHKSPQKVKFFVQN